MGGRLPLSLKPGANERETPSSNNEGDGAPVTEGTRRVTDWIYTEWGIAFFWVGAVTMIGADWADKASAFWQGPALMCAMMALTITHRRHTVRAMNIAERACDLVRDEARR